MSILRYPVALPSNCRPEPFGVSTSAEGPFARLISTSTASRTETSATGLLDLNRYLIDNVSSTSLFRVIGHSLIGIGIYDEDLVTVDRSVPPHSGQVVLAVINGDLILRIFFSTGTSYELQPANTDYQAIRIPDGGELNVVGVVTGVVRKLI